eukprot:143727-Rhodomonas_salina.2
MADHVSSSAGVSSALRRVKYLVLDEAGHSAVLLRVSPAYPGTISALTCAYSAIQRMPCCGVSTDIRVACYALRLSCRRS